MLNIRQTTKTLIKILLGKSFFIKADCLQNYEHFGSEYGGWNIVANQLSKNSIIYSFGIGEDASFDLEIINGIGTTVHAFDPTPKSIKWVKGQNFSKHFVLHEYGIADFDGLASFCPPENSNHISHTILERTKTKQQAIKVPVKTLKVIMEELQHSNIDLLKMDIEGAEYSVIENMRSSNIRPKQLLIEFHHRFPNVGIAKTKNTINIIKSMGYGLFAVSDSGEEFSFIQKVD